MIPSIKIKATLADGRVLHASTTPRDLLAVERAQGRSISSLFQDVSFEVIATLAHSALQRTGQWSEGFEQFVDALADIGIDEASSAPFDGAPSGG